VELFEKTCGIASVALWSFAEDLARATGDDADMTMTATARSAESRLRNEVDVNGRHVVVTDEPQRLGGTDTGPAPHELLPVMLASCVSTMITLYARARGWELGELRVDAAYDPDSTPRHVELRVYLPDGLTPDQIRRLRKVADTCPARRALEAGFTFDEQIVVGTRELSPRSSESSRRPAAA
jgi:putative redox protein